MRGLTFAVLFAALLSAQHRLNTHVWSEEGSAWLNTALIILFVWAIIFSLAGV